MRRRALLAALAASTSAAAGCSVLQSDERTRAPLDVEETTRPPTTGLEYDPPDAMARGFRAPADADHEVVVGVPRKIPEGVMLSVGFTSPPSSESPATLYASVVVPADADGPVELPVGATPPLSAYRGDRVGGGDGLLLVPERAGTEMGSVVKRDRGCWRPRRAAVPASTSARSVELSPGEGLEREYYVVTSWGTDRCLRPGRYRFQAPAGWRVAVSAFERVEPERSRYEDPDVPPLPGFQGTRWYHATDADVFLEPEAESVGLPTAAVAFTFHNQRWRPLRAPADAWRLYKRRGDAWYPIAPLTRGDGERVFHPGSRERLELDLFTDPDAPGDARTAVGGLDGGTYAVAYPTAYTVPRVESDLEREGPTAALVAVVGERPALTTTGAVDHVADDGHVRHAYTTPDESAIATLQLRRIEDAPGERLILEQVLQRDALRNALATLRTAPDATTTVAYHTDPSAIERTVALVDPDARGLRFRFVNANYEMTYR